MRILVLTTWFPSSVKPTEAPFNLNHAAAIALHHDVRVVHVRLHSSLMSQSESYAGLNVRRLSFDLRRPWTVVGALIQIRKELRDADVLHTMAFSATLVAALARPLSHRPWVHTEHWNGVLNPQSVSGLWASFAGLRQVLRLPNWLTGVTTQLAETLSQFGRPETTSVVPCIVENPLPLVSRPHGKRLQLLAVGGLIERKKPLMAVETVKWLLDQGHDVGMTWVGDGSLRERVLKEAKRLGISDRFLLAGSVNPESVFDYFQDADVFFLPTAQENFFTSAAEALSAGRPVVAARVGGFYDYVDERNGVLIDEATPENFGKAILQAQRLCDTESVESMAWPIRARFSQTRVAAQFDEIYKIVTEGKLR